MVGDIYLEVTDQVWIEEVKLTTDPKLKRVFANLWVGKGRLLICTSQLEKCAGDPVAHKLHEYLQRYVASDRFNPRDELTIDVIQSFFE